MDVKYIWALYDAFETERLYAEIDGDNLVELTERLNESETDRNDGEALTKEKLESIIKTEIADGTDLSLNFGCYTLQRCPLNVIFDGDVMFDDPEFVVEKGAKVYEAAQRVNLGCDASHALSPAGYFTRKPDLPGGDLEWIERVLN